MLPLPYTIHASGVECPAGMQLVAYESLQLMWYARWVCMYCTVCMMGMGCASGGWCTRRCRSCTGVDMIAGVYG